MSCAHVQLLRDVRSLITETITANGHAPVPKSYELAKLTRAREAIDKVLSTLSAGTTVDVDEDWDWKRLTPNEVFAYQTLLERAYGEVPGGKAKCPCELEGNETHQLLATTQQLLDHGGMPAYEVAALSTPALHVHLLATRGTSTVRAEPDFSGFDVQTLCFLYAIQQKAIGKPIPPPTHGCTCDVCGRNGLPCSDPQPSQLDICPVCGPR